MLALCETVQRGNILHVTRERYACTEFVRGFRTGRHSDGHGGSPEVAVKSICIHSPNLEMRVAHLKVWAVNANRFQSFSQFMHQLAGHTCTSPPLKPAAIRVPSGDHATVNISPGCDCPCWKW